VVTVKEREIVVPNLSMVYELPAVDGFDGGLLPSAAYVQVADLLLPPGVDTIDGRLRESLRTTPDDRWLDLFNVRYLITDKVGDQWFRGPDGEAFFDLQQRVALPAGASVAVGYVPPFEATELWAVAEGAPASVTVGVGDSAESVPFEPLADKLYRARWQTPQTPSTLAVTAGAEPVEIAGLVLFDARDATFRQVVPGQYRLIHSGDVKIYENMDVLPRAFVVNTWQSAPDVASVVALMRDSAFDPRTQAVVLGDGGAGQGAGDGVVAVIDYRPNRVEMVVSAENPALLVLTDAAYPGWQVTLDGAPAPVETVNGLFRGVFVPTGTTTVIFTLSDAPVRRAALVTLVAALLWVMIWRWSKRWSGS
jgi:hypothetical protein